MTTQATIERPLGTGPLAKPGRTHATRAAAIPAALALALALGLSLGTLVSDHPSHGTAANALVRSPAQPPPAAHATDTPTYAPHTLVVGFRGPASKLLSEVRAAARSLTAAPSVTAADRSLTAAPSVTAAARSLTAAPSVTAAAHILTAAPSVTPADRSLTPADRSLTAADRSLTAAAHSLTPAAHSLTPAAHNPTATHNLAGTRISTRPSLTPGERILRLPNDASVPAAARAVAKLPNVTYAVPDYIAHIAGDFYPDDTGRGSRPQGWEKLQWNFLPGAGVDAPQAWANLAADGRPGAKGVTIAVVDTGVAFRNWRTYTQSPDFDHTRFAHPCDLVAGTIRHGRCTDPYPLDRESHGTFVTGTIAESTNNHIGLTGLAYEATIIPVRVLDADGNGDSSTIAAGIRYAVQQGAQVINLSIEFSPGTTVSEIPSVASAITYAYDHNVVVVGAAGNDEETALDYPAALSDVISVGATTSDLCLADYSDVGPGLDLVAPGGGDDATAVPGSLCHANRNLPDIYQMTFSDPTHPNAFGLPSGWFGTSMAAPNVTAAAAMVIASGVIGRHPTPAAILARLEATARPLGQGSPNVDYGYGLVDVGAATATGGPLTPVTTTSTSTSTNTSTTTATTTSATDTSTATAPTSTAITTTSEPTTT